MFKVTRGQVLAATETSEEQSDISPFPVYSSQTKNNGLMGYYKDYLFDTAITWTTDGANAGTVSYRKGRFYSTNVNGVLISDKGYTNKAISEILNLEAWKWVSHVGNPKLMNNVMGNISIVIPKSFVEQDRLSKFFKQLDNLTTQNERKIDLLKQLKQAYLQKIFSQELRFTGFNDGWEERDLSAISDKVTEKNKENQFSETFTNSAEYGIINQRDFFDKDISNEKNLNGYYIVHENDFVYNPRISNYAPVGPIKRNKLGRTGVMSPLYYVFRSRGVDKKYLEYYFDTTAWHIFLKMNGDSGARSDRFAIKDSVFNQMPIPYPTIGEQEQIGSFFEKLDKTIALRQQKLNLLKKQKHAYLQKMFI
ncbi:restriction endonuclease subunit S [Leuconostoc mesenteroides]|uniref:restriction endonuclease subunit S n=1 Tax=Leuconostoc mesenteroides TaxID=1245 RepID=UPI002200400E|nr:restriction endonuclease subunit S [Leuconostoc mesenteroides]